MVIVLSSITISYVVDTLGKRTRFSGALVAGTLVAFVSSLPEFTSSLTSVLGPDHLLSSAIGNLIGGNLFRTFALSALCIMFIVAMKKAKTTKIQVCLIIVQTVVATLNLVMMVEYPRMSSALHYSFMAVDILCLALYGFTI
ncbi:hypothetical protein FACS1894166_01520 [Bacilli bacterium]|nr:hypothetical protein FACS1894166_01520 [Bacilli bacterium]